MLALLLALLPFAPASAQAARGTDNVCPPPGETESDQFNDDEGSVHEDNINCVAQYGIARGFVDGTYRPAENISRGQMATFVANMVETALGEALPEGPDRFDDDDGTTHEANVNKVANAGIVSGRGGRIYDPGGLVDRAAMATFIARAIDYSDDEAVNGSQPPPTDSDEFDDDEGSVHEDNINRLAVQNIVVGVGDRQFDPNAPTVRAQMATFVMQGASYLAEIGAWAPVAEFRVALAPQDDENTTGTVHTVTATVFVGQETVAAGHAVRFEVFRDGAADPVTTGVRNTDQDGEADFTYTGPSSAAEDEIVACANEDGTAPQTCADADASARASKTWIQPAAPPPAYPPHAAVTDGVATTVAASPPDDVATPWYRTNAALMGLLGMLLLVPLGGAVARRRAGRAR